MRIRCEYGVPASYRLMLIVLATFWSYSKRRGSFEERLHVLIDCEMPARLEL